MSVQERPQDPPYGPNTVLVRRFLQLLAARSERDWIAASRAYFALQRDARFADADRQLAEAIGAAGRERARDAVVGPILQLSKGVSQSAGGALPQGLNEETVAEAALAAALALVARDRLPAVAFDTLYGPFAALIPVAQLEGA